MRHAQMNMNTSAFVQIYIETQIKCKNKCTVFAALNY